MCADCLQQLQESKHPDVRRRPNQTGASHDLLGASHFRYLCSRCRLRMEAVHHSYQAKVPQDEDWQPVSHVCIALATLTTSNTNLFSNGPDSLPWINEFVQTCPECKFDFLDVHYYWTTSEFQNFVETWHKRFPHKAMWVSDIGFQSYSPDPPECQEGDTSCVPDIKTQIKFLDKKRYVKRYTFRGEFRTDQGQPHQPLWSFLDDNGDYTPLGKWYLGIS